MCAHVNKEWLSWCSYCQGVYSLVRVQHEEGAAEAGREGGGRLRNAHLRARHLGRGESRKELCSVYQDAQESVQHQGPNQRSKQQVLMGARRVLPSQSPSLLGALLANTTPTCCPDPAFSHLGGVLG